MKKRVTVLLLVLALAFSLMPAALAEGWTEPDAPNDVVWSGTTLEGEAIDSATYAGLVQILIFFRANGKCPNSNNTLQTLNTAGWTDEEDVRVVAFGVGESGESPDTVREHTEAMRDTYAPQAKNVDFVPIDSSVMWDYARKCGYGSSITYALVVVVDRENVIRCTWKGAYWGAYYREAIDYVLDRQVEPNPGPGAEVSPEPDGDAAYNVTVTGYANYEYAYQVAERLNALRASLGLGQLTVDAKLMETAMARAAECSVYYDHTRPDGTACYVLFPRRLGTSSENIAAGQSTPEEVMEMWTKSPGHYANMADPGVNAVGVGCFELDGVIYWTQCFTGGDREPETVRGEDGFYTYTVPVIGANFDIEDWDGTLTAMEGQSGQLYIFYINKEFPGYYMRADGVEGLTVSVEGDAVTAEADPFTVTAVSPGTAVVTVTAPDGDTAKLRVEVEAAPSFTDVPEGAAYRDAVAWAAWNGITGGTGNGAFSPDRTVSRAELVTFLWRALGEPTPMSGAAAFTDLDAGRDGYALTAVAWAVENGITRGTNEAGTRFSPTDTCTRSQVVTMLYRAFREPEVAGESGYADVPTDAFYADAVTWAVQWGIASPGDTFGPDEPCCRAEVVTWLYNALA